MLWIYYARQKESEPNSSIGDQYAACDKLRKGGTVEYFPERDSEQPDPKALVKVQLRRALTLAEAHPQSHFAISSIDRLNDDPFIQCLLIAMIYSQRVSQLHISTHPNVILERYFEKALTQYERIRDAERGLQLQIDYLGNRLEQQEKPERRRSKGKRVPIATTIRTAIENSGFSANELAARSGVSQPSITRFLSGERSLNLETADKLCRCLGLSFV